jgi:hypothetical protein
MDTRTATDAVIRTRILHQVLHSEVISSDQEQFVSKSVLRMKPYVFYNLHI